MPSWTILLLALLGCTWLLASLLGTMRGRRAKAQAHEPRYKTRLPPGPPGIPILGNLLMLGELPHRDLERLAKLYGPIMYLRLGRIPTIIVSSPQAAQLFLKTHDLAFASRPFIEASKYMGYDRKGLAFTEYGPYWRVTRKLCTLELFSNLKVELFGPMRREELGLLVESLRDTARARSVVDVSAKLSLLTMDMTYRMVFGKKYSDEDMEEVRGVRRVLQEALQLTATFNFGDYVPLVGALDLQGLRRKMRAVSKVLDQFLNRIVDEHENATGPQKDFIDIMLSFVVSNPTDGELPFDRTNIKAIVLDMIAAGIDTTATTIEWALAELLRHPEIMKKAQEELENVVGMDRFVEETDLGNLAYLEMVLKESMRLHPTAPLLLPHESIEACTVNGFDIPQKSRIIINTWAIGKDPNVWPEPDKFWPERFLSSTIDLKGHDFQLIPFGSGRRGCPGMQLGLTLVRLVLAQLVHCFDWELPDGLPPDQLDMREVFGLTAPRANHLLAIPTYRLLDKL